MLDTSPVVESAADLGAALPPVINDNPAENVLIYSFECAGYFYAGKRVVSSKTAHLRAGDTGAGPLPCGYAGSGKLWRNVLRKHGRAALRWRIVAVLPNATRADWRPVEQAEIARLRATHGDVRDGAGGKCLNWSDGGEGLTSADAARQAAAQFADPAKRARSAAANRKLWEDPDFRARNAAALRDTHGADPAPAPVADACAALLASVNAGHDTLSNACMDIVLLHPAVPQWQLIELAVARGHKRSTATLLYAKATGAAQVLGGVKLESDQTVEAAVTAWPAVLAEAEAMKAAQVAGGKRLVGAASGVTKLALTLMALRFAAVPGGTLARALRGAHEVGTDNAMSAEFSATRRVAARAVALGKTAGMCPILVAALSVPGDPRHAGFAAAQDAAIAIARANQMGIAA